MPAPTAEPQGLLTMEQMVAELYRTVCVSRAGQPCVVDQVNAHGVRLDGHDKWISKHESSPEVSIWTKMGNSFLMAIAGSLGLSFVGVIGWGIVTILRRASGTP